MGLQLEKAFSTLISPTRRFIYENWPCSPCDGEQMTSSQRSQMTLDWAKKTLDQVRTLEKESGLDYTDVLEQNGWAKDGCIDTVMVQGMGELWSEK
jgi:hypothetical protein